MNNEKKLSYEAPEMEIIAFEAEDVIRTSGADGNNDPFDGGEDGFPQS